MPENPAKPAVMVARCLGGSNCRYHGYYTPPRLALLKRLAPKYEVILFCPEEAAGMSTPRPPAQWKKGRLFADGKDVTEAFERGAQLALHVALGCGVKKFYGLRNSPSCDPQTGVTARLLTRHGIRCLLG
jgi:uncharacterized protein YbbK (DUF523 family)